MSEQDFQDQHGTEVEVELEDEPDAPVGYDEEE